MPFKPDAPAPAAAQTSAPAGRFRPDAPVRPPLGASNDLPPLPGSPGYDEYDAQFQPTSEMGEKNGFLSRALAAARDVAEKRPAFSGPNLGDVEAIASFGTGMVAPFLASARGLIGGYEPTNAEIEDVTYQPRTEQGQAQVAAMGELLRPLDKAGAGQALLGMVPEASAGAPRGPLARAPKGAKAGKVAAPLSEGRAAAARIRNQGLKLTPKEASQITGDKNFFGRALQAIGGDAKVSGDIAAANRPVINTMGRKAIGADSLTEAGLKPVKDAGNAVYSEMSALGDVAPTAELRGAIEKARGSAGRSTQRNTGIDRFVDNVLNEFAGEKVNAGQVVNRVRELRRDAQNSRTGEGAKRPTIQNEALGQAQRAVADALDDFLEYNAATAGKPKLAEKYRETRTRLAKVGTVEGATRAGNLSAKKVFEAKEKGVPLTGKLDEVAVAHEYAPQSTGAAGVEALMDPPGRNLGLLELPVAGLQAAARHTGINKFLQSDFYQNMIAGREGGPHLAEHDINPGFSWPARAPARPAPPAVDFAGELGLVPDGPFESLPGGVAAPVNARALAEAPGLQLVEDVTPAGVAPNALRNGPDDINFEVVNPGDVAPYRLNTDLPLTDARPPIGAQRGAAVNMAGDLELAPDVPPGPYQELPPKPRGKPRQGGAPREPAPKPAPTPAPAEALPPEGLSELGAMIDAMLNTKRNPGGPAKVTGYRGVAPGADPFDTSGSLGNALFFTPDEATARSYGSNVASRDLEFQNLLQTKGDTLEAVRQALGLADTAELVDVINAARAQSYDGVTYDLKPGREYIQIPKTQK